jgi:demethoxyubiquinone hydroxylase (CLK1/Coq7/Cat5 family)
VTYAIELRAGELYPLYQTILKQHQSKIQVQSILVEEKEHLQEMADALSPLSDAPIYIKNICQIEARLFKRWLTACRSNIVYLAPTLRKKPQII